MDGGGKMGEADASWREGEGGECGSASVGRLVVKVPAQAYKISI